MKNLIPSKKDWGELDKDLDKISAYQSFYGKSTKEIYSYFNFNIIEACCDIGWMPQIPFQYYFIVLKDFIEKKYFEDLSKSDASSCYLEIMIEKLENNPNYILPIIGQLLPTAEYIACHQVEFEADIDIYDNFQLLYEKILDLYSKT